MKRYLFGLFLLCTLSLVTYQGLAYNDFDDSPSMQEYFSASPENENKPIMYIFYLDSDCYMCAQTIALTEEIYNKYYQNALSLFVINYEEDEGSSFAEAYELTDPMDIVLLEVQDGQSYGYKKIRNPQYQMVTPQDYERFLSVQLNEFLD